MSDKFADALDTISSVPKQLLFVLGVASATILFIPHELASILAVDEFRKSYRVYLGPGLVVVSAWLFARAVSAVGGSFKQRKLQRLRRQTL